MTPLVYNLSNRCAPAHVPGCFDESIYMAKPWFQVVLRVQSSREVMLRRIEGGRGRSGLGVFNLFRWVLLPNHAERLDSPKQRRFVVCEDA